MKLALSLAAALAVALATLASSLGSHESPPVPLSAAPQAVTETAAEPAPAAAGLDEARTRSVGREEAERPPQAAPASDDAIVSGRCVDPDERPVPGVNLRWLVGRTGTGEPIERTAQTDVEGRFEVSWHFPTGYGFTLELGGDGYGRQHFHSSDLEPGSRKDLGDITVWPGGTVFGSVLEPDGTPCAAGWRLQVMPDGHGVFMMRARPQDETGAFRFEDVQPGAYVLLSIFGEDGVSALEFRVGAGEELELDLRRKPTRSTAASVRAFFYADWGVALPPEHVSLVTPRGERLHPQGSSSHMELRDLEPGRYALEIDDPRFEPWRRDGIEPGAEPVAVDLEGECTLELALVDATSGEPVEPYRATLHLAGGRTRRGGMRGPTGVALRAEGAPAPAGGLYAGVTTRGGELRIEAPGYAPIEHALARLELRERRVVSLQMTPLPPVAALSGIVVDERGDPPAFPVRVGLFAPAAVGDGPASPMWSPVPLAGYVPKDERCRIERHARHCAADGSFRFESVPHGTWIPAALAGQGLVAVAAPITLGEGGASSAVVLRLPTAAMVEGRLLAPAGASLEGLRVSLGADRAALAAEVDAAGRFQLGPTVPGPVELTLVHPLDEGLRKAVGWFAIHGAPRRSLGRIELAPGVNRWERELGDLLPGAVSLHLRRDGAKLPDAVVELFWEDGSKQFPESIAAATDGNGHVRFAGVAPGRWQATVSTRGLGMITSRYVEPDLFRVVSGEELELWLEVEIVKGSLRVTDAESGDALAQESLCLISYGRGASRQTLRSDGEGRVELELPPGSYAVARKWPKSSDDEPVSAPFEWTSSGPAVEVLALP